MSEQEIRAKVDYIFGLYEKHGAEAYYGEEVSQLEHMCQSAELARAGGYDDEVILAAFFHDIGYLIESETRDTMGAYGRVNHEKEAGDFIRKMGFSDKVASIAEQHVNAKRYLTYADPEYYSRLSEASKNTLHYQGGPMTEEEATQFKSQPLFDFYIAMRRWDEAGKEKAMPLPDLSLYKEIAYKHLLAQP